MYLVCFLVMKHTLTVLHLCAEEVVHDYQSIVFCLPAVMSCVLLGGGDGRVHVFSTQTGILLKQFEGPHPAACRCVAFNPKNLMLASACSVMAFWIPDLSNPALEAI